MPRKSQRNSRRRICFVTGTRAEFGLMQSVLEAIESHPNLQLQIVAAGMHLDPRYGQTIKEIRKDGWQINAVIPWRGSRAAATGRAIAALAETFETIMPDIVLVVGDRVEAFAAATAAHLRDIAVAHVHGGDRALGQMDDALRHAISRLSHIHFPATRQSAARLKKMGEDSWRICRAGSPGVDGIEKLAATASQISKEFPEVDKFALLLLHPITADESLERRRAKMLSDSLRDSDVPRTVIIYPNNDPGSAGILKQWDSLKNNPRFILRASVPRESFLGLLRDAALLIGNSSSGIIEAASFRTPVVNVGPRQLGRERTPDVANVPYRPADLSSAIARIWNHGCPLRTRHSNIYGRRGTAKIIAQALSALKIDEKLLRKVISY